MIPVIDRAALYFIGGIVAGFLEGAGIADPGKHSENVETIQTVAQAVTILVTIILGFRHERHKLSQATEISVPSKTYSLQPILDFFAKLRGAFVKEVKPQTEFTVNSANDVPQTVI